jgi:hypothetical protein
MVGDLANTTCVDAVLASEKHQYIAIDRRTADGASLDVALRLKHSRSVGMLDHLPHEENEARRAEYNRPAASPRWVRMGTISGADHAIAFAPRRNETRSLS